MAMYKDGIFLSVIRFIYMLLLEKIVVSVNSGLFLSQIYFSIDFSILFWQSMLKYLKLEKL